MNIAIHAHVFYPELWDELASCIRNFQGYPYDLFVTTPHPDETLKKQILSDFPDANYRVLENRGYDVGPFMEFLNGLDLDKYDFIVKLHTKRDYNGIVNLRHFKGSEWRIRLLDFCSSPENLSRTLAAFDKDPLVGMLSHGSLITDVGDFLEDTSVRQSADMLLEDMGLIPRGHRFVAGTCFIVRASLIKPLVGRFKLSDFTAGGDHRYSLAHILERLFGYLVSAQGCQILGIPSASRIMEFLIMPLLPFHRVIRTLHNRTKPVSSDGTGSFDL